MKMAMITYNVAVGDEVMEVLEHCALKNYTKMDNVYGKGTTSGTHLGTDVWPGKNSLLFVSGEDDQIKQLISCVKELRKKIGREGVKAFVWKLEEAT